MKASELHQIAPTLTEPKLSEYAKLISEALHKAGIIDTHEIAAFVSQSAHETMDFSRLSENLYYTADRLMAVWPSRFPNVATAVKYARDPVKLANHVYANRMGNGDEKSGDGWKYRGRGIPQLTGKDNYLACGNWMGVDLVADPDKLLEIGNAVQSGIWFWETNHLGSVLKRHGISAVSKRINGGETGLVKRIAGYEKALQVLVA